MRGIIGKLLKARGRDRPRTLLGRLRTDVRGNTLALMAAALIPLCGMVGGGLDMARMYMTKTRLQHACDAGALAGRKHMGAGTWGTDDQAKADQFFDANFTSTGMYGADAPTVTFTENSGKVTGTASSTLPMTLMKVLAIPDQTLTVTCDAEMRLPNTDIMFVLDTTGSMASPLPGDTKTKMAALKGAVKCFYEIVARLDTTEVCGTGSGPSGGTGNQVQIRFGFVPYATNVNVGRLLPTSYFADSWDYQTREAKWNNSGSTQTWAQTSSAVQETVNTSRTNVPQNYCNDATAEAAGLNPQTGYTYTNNNTQRWYDKTLTTVTGWTSANGGTCSGTQTRTRYFETSQTNTTQTFHQWQYKQHAVNVGLLKNGTLWNNSFQWPIGPNGTNKTITWQGCIEERHTVATTDYDPIPSDADDLDIDAEPSQGDPNSLWGMALPELIYLRASPTYYAWGTPYSDSNAYSLATQNTTADYYNMSNTDSNYSCPSESKKLQAWPTASTFETYVDGLVPSGNTYHDIGLLWGARLMSPTGIFGSENDFTPQGGEIDRHMIFMTDGDACTGVANYTAYGIPWFDRRQTAQNAVPTAGCTWNSATLTEQVNLRTEALCTAIKNKNITLWVISFGSLETPTLNRLSNCATTSRYYSANNSAELYATFNTIANSISQLRLTK
jgi:Flp pilus assembly protein TadG